MDGSIWLAWAIKNSLCVASWVALAMVFDKWWIALFGLLFVSEIKAPAYFRVCDKCGKRSEYTLIPEKALEKAQEDGWVHIADGDKDYCPDCKRLLYESKNMD